MNRLSTWLIDTLRTRRFIKVESMEASFSHRYQLIKKTLGLTFLHPFDNEMFTYTMHFTYPQRCVYFLMQFFTFFYSQLSQSFLGHILSMWKKYSVFFAKISEFFFWVQSTEHYIIDLSLVNQKINRNETIERDGWRETRNAQENVCVNSNHLKWLYFSSISLVYGCLLFSLKFQTHYFNSMSRCYPAWK